MKNLVLGLAMIFALTTVNFAQATVVSFDITEKMVIDAQNNWCNALVAINESKEKGGDYKKLASDVLDAAYNYNNGIVLFKPTLTTGEQTFRMDKEGALAYFVGGNTKYKDDSGFAIKGWKKCESQPKGIVLSGDVAMSMGNVRIWNAKGEETMVDKTWGYKMDDKGVLRIVLHHSSLPYKPTTTTAAVKMIKTSAKAKTKKNNRNNLNLKKIKHLH